MDHTDLKSYVTKLCLTISENTIIILIDNHTSARQFLALNLAI